MNSKTKEVRHEMLKSEPIHTMYGVVQLDHDGYVTNLGSLDGSAEDLIKNVPHFVDASVFPLERTEAPPAEPIVAEPVVVGPDTSTAPGATADGEAGKPAEDTKESDGGSGADNTGVAAEDAPYVAALTEYLAKPDAKVNSEGYVVMDAFNDFLKEKDLKPVSGTKRKELTDTAGLKKGA